jgi:GT2 family glycosyltransferase
MEPSVSIVTPTFNRREQLLNMLRSVSGSAYPQELIEVLIVDNGADPGLAEALKQWGTQVRLISPGKNLFSNAARQLALTQARGSVIFFLDDDNSLHSDCIRNLVSALDQNPELGLVGPLMLDGDSDIIWCAGAAVTYLGTVAYFFPSLRYSKAVLPNLIRGVQFFPNACMVRKEVLDAAPLDVKTFPHNWAETDFGLRATNAGFKAACVTSAIDRHYVGYGGLLTRFHERTLYDQAKSRMLFRKRHLPKVSHWVAFWTIVFPASTLAYASRIIRMPRSRWKMVQMYFKGTIDGLRARPLDVKTEIRATSQ